MNLNDKTECSVQVRNLKQTLNHGLFKRVHNVIKFNQRFLLKQYIYLNFYLRKAVKNNFEKDFLKLTNHSVLRNTNTYE